LQIPYSRRRGKSATGQITRYSFIDLSGSSLTTKKYYR